MAYYGKGYKVKNNSDIIEIDVWSALLAPMHARDKEPASFMLLVSMKRRDKEHARSVALDSIKPRDKDPSYSLRTPMTGGTVWG